MEFNKNLGSFKSRDSNKKPALSLTHLTNRILSRPDSLVTSETLINPYYQPENYMYQNYENQDALQWQLW